MKRQSTLSILLVLTLLFSFALPSYAAGFSGYKPQLKGIETDIYNALEENLTKPNTTFTCTFSSPQEYASEKAAGDAAQNATFRAYEAFYREHPEVFWVPKSLSLTVAPKIETAAGKSRLTELALTSSFTDAADIPKKKQALEAAASKILAQAAGNDYERLVAIHDAIVNGCSYSMEAKNAPTQYPYAYESYGALVGGSAVCEGYAKSFKMLCDRLGIPCVLVCGTVEGEPHMWNYVQLGDAYYLVDATFDDPVGGEPTKDYFLKGADSTADHKPGGGFLKNFSAGFTEPTLSKADFDPKNAGSVGTSSTTKTPGSAGADDAVKENCTVRMSIVGSGRGSVTYAGVDAALDYGQTVRGGVSLTVNALADPGYRVEKITVTMGGATQESTSRQMTFSVTDNCNIEVRFTKDA